MGGGDIGPHAPHPRKVAVVGPGNVGATFAYAMVLNGLVGEIVLIDVDRERAEGEAMDFNHAVPLSNPVRVWAGEYSDCAGADGVVVTAGTAQRPGEIRVSAARRLGGMRAAQVGRESTDGPLQRKDERGA